MKNCRLVVATRKAKQKKKNKKFIKHFYNHPIYLMLSNMIPVSVECHVPRDTLFLFLESWFYKEHLRFKGKMLLQDKHVYGNYSQQNVLLNSRMRKEKLDKKSFLLKKETIRVENAKVQSEFFFFIYTFILLLNPHFLCGKFNTCISSVMMKILRKIPISRQCQLFLI